MKEVLKRTRQILGFIIQGFGFIIVAPALVLLAVGGAIIDFGDTLRID